MLVVALIFVGGESDVPLYAPDWLDSGLVRALDAVRTKR